MSKLTRAQRKAKIAATIKVNGNKEITPPKDKILRDDEVDSVPSLKDGGMEFEQQVGYQSEFDVSDPKAFTSLRQTNQLIEEAISDIPTGDYLPRNGSMAMEAALPLGGNNIVEVNQIISLSEKGILDLDGVTAGITRLDDSGSKYATLSINAEQGEAGLAVVEPGSSVYFVLNMLKGISWSTNTGGNSVNFKNDNITENYTVQWPDKSGTQVPAMISDLSGIGSGTVTNVSISTANGFSGSVSNPSTTPEITLTLQNATSLQSGQLTAADWNTFNNKQSSISLTTSGNNGAATFVGNTLNIPTYTLAGLGGFANPMTTSGDIIYGGVSGVATRLAVGSTARVLTAVGGVPTWSSALLEGGTSNSALRIGTGSTIGTAFSVAIGINAGQLSAL